MLFKPVEICVYGAEVICPSCVNLPSSKETYEWLEAAIKRKYPDQPFTISYIDIFNPPEDEEKKAFAAKVIEEDLFYPVVLVEGTIVGEGNPKLKVIYEAMEKYGYKAVEKE
ncbi:YuzD family protein [Thermaerobacillus caldiproteolyticus]|uniref:Disulfide oxidoreductase YuzD n=1 Tax=Thermaerobacillus caldiproteolyticus TaxID=247480 RepID=A0A7V9Z7S4_9BACL|nr:YuzD family protein [Anoxybacillus caldiproteolyticus]MBA2875629.1 disulfide oxidoreductase YuzD [Anoxybacillus caldiproteolyticus]QPA33271.1 YuzD family protein [Anoxybacillus caldiproteolyticus]